MDFQHVGTFLRSSLVKDPNFLGDFFDFEDMLLIESQFPQLFGGPEPEIDNKQLPSKIEKLDLVNPPAASNVSKPMNVNVRQQQNLQASPYRGRVSIWPPIRKRVPSPIKKEKEFRQPLPPSSLCKPIPKEPDYLKLKSTRNAPRVNVNQQQNLQASRLSVWPPKIKSVLSPIKKEKEFQPPPPPSSLCKSIPKEPDYLKLKSTRNALRVNVKQQQNLQASRLSVTPPTTKSVPSPIKKGKEFRPAPPPASSLCKSIQKEATKKHLYLDLDQSPIAEKPLETAASVSRDEQLKLAQLLASQYLKEGKFQKQTTSPHISTMEEDEDKTESSRLATSTAMTNTLFISSSTPNYAIAAFQTIQSPSQSLPEASVLNETMRIRPEQTTRAALEKIAQELIYVEILKQLHGNGQQRRQMVDAEMETDAVEVFNDNLFRPLSTIPEEIDHIQTPDLTPPLERQLLKEIQKKIQESVSELLKTPTLTQSESLHERVNKEIPTRDTAKERHHKIKDEATDCSEISDFMASLSEQTEIKPSPKQTSPIVASSSKSNIPLIKKSSSSTSLSSFSVSISETGKAYLKAIASYPIQRPQQMEVKLSRDSESNLMSLNQVVATNNGGVSSQSSLSDIITPVRISQLYTEEISDGEFLAYGKSPGEVSTSMHLSPGLYMDNKTKNLKKEESDSSIMVETLSAGEIKTEES